VTNSPYKRHVGFVAPFGVLVQVSLPALQYPLVRGPKR